MEIFGVLRHIYLKVNNFTYSDIWKEEMRESRGTPVQLVEHQI